MSRGWTAWRNSLQSLQPRKSTWIAWRITERTLTGWSRPSSSGATPQPPCGLPRWCRTVFSAGPWKVMPFRETDPIKNQPRRNLYAVPDHQPGLRCPVWWGVVDDPGSQDLAGAAGPGWARGPGAPERPAA